MTDAPLSDERISEIEVMRGDMDKVGFVEAYSVVAESIDDLLREVRRLREQKAELWHVVRRWLHERDNDNSPTPDELRDVLSRCRISLPQFGPGEGINITDGMDAVDYVRKLRDDD